MMKNNTAKWLNVSAILSYAAGVFMIVDRSLWLGIVLVAVGACLSCLAVKKNREESKQS